MPELLQSFHNRSKVRSKDHL